MMQGPMLQQVVDINRTVHTVGPEATVAEAAGVLSAHAIGCLVVVSTGGGIAGVISERDIVGRVVAEGLDPRTVRVCEIMSTDVVACTPNTPIVEAQRVMSERGMRHLPVVRDGQLLGIISGRDILTHQLLATTVLMLQHGEPAAL